jgi:hypothetical protein
MQGGVCWLSARGRGVLALAGAFAAVLLPPGSIASPSGEAEACSTAWASAVAGSWADAAKWTNGVPDSAKTACITVDGTYTVTVNGDASTQGLTLGGAAGTQTLLIRGAGSNATLTSSQLGGATGIGTNGRLVLQTSGTGWSAYQGNSAFPLVNDGTIRASAAGGGNGRLYLHGDLVNNGVLDVDRSLTQNDFGADWTNEGTIDVAARAVLNPMVTLTQAGLIRNSGVFEIRNELLRLVGGNATGNPIRLESADVDPSAGTAKIDVTGGWCELVGDVGPGVTLRIFGEGSDSILTSEGNTNRGTLVLEATSTGEAELLLSNTVAFTNEGTLKAIRGNVGGLLYVGGDLVNEGLIDIDWTLHQSWIDSEWVNNGTIDIALGVLVYLASGSGSSLVQHADGVLKAGLGYGRVVGNSALELDGTLELEYPKTFDPAPGLRIDVLAGSSVTGGFSGVTRAAITTSKYLRPDYSSTEAALVATEASLAVEPTSGPPGSSLTVQGSAYPAGDAVTVTLKDRRGTVFTLGTATTDANGSFSNGFLIPASTATGKSKIVATSAITGVKPAVKFTVK